MRKILAFSWLAVAPALFADSVVCTSFSSDAVIPCSSLSLSTTEEFPVLHVSGNTLEAFTFVDVENGPAHNPPASVIATANDTLAFPTSPPGDVFKVSGYYGNSALGPYVGSVATSSLLLFQIGPGSASSPEITNPPPSPGGCPPNGEEASCTLPLTTVPSSAFSFVTLQGNATIAIDLADSRAGAYFYADLDISRFKADGVTPDPFTATPEPASWALLACSGVVFSLLGRAHRRGR